MKKEDIKGICVSVLEKIKNVEVSKKELGQEFIQLGLQISVVESCERISDTAKQYAYLLSDCYQPESCEWSELADDINELCVDIYQASISLDVDIFLDARIHFVEGINHLKSILESTQCDKMTTTEANEFTKCLGHYIEELKSIKEN